MPLLAQSEKTPETLAFEREIKPLQDAVDAYLKKAFQEIVPPCGPRSRSKHTAGRGRSGGAAGRERRAQAATWTSTVFHRGSGF